MRCLLHALWILRPAVGRWRAQPGSRRCSSIGLSPMVSLRPGPAAKAVAVLPLCVPSRHAASGPSTPAGRIAKNWAGLPSAFQLVWGGALCNHIAAICGYVCPDGCTTFEPTVQAGLLGRIRHHPSTERPPTNRRRRCDICRHSHFVRFDTAGLHCRIRHHPST